MKYVCKICGFIYDEATQDAKWNDLDTDWVCPVCKAPKEKFEAVAETSTSKYEEDTSNGIKGFKN